MRTSSAASELPRVSVIIACRNEAAFVAQCLDSVVATTYPKDRLEVLMVDGLSEDGTRDILAKYAARFSFIKVVDNPGRITPAGLNIGVRSAQGSVIMWMSAHAEYPVDYVTMCVTYLRDSGADNVGGIIRTVPRTPTLVGEAIALVMSHPFGVGNSAFRTGAGQPVWTDTVFGGCYRRDVFERIGLWNEQLARSQDIELNIRLRAAGGRILLVPDIVCSYHARSDLLSFVRHNFGNGIWAILPFAYSRIVPVRARHLVPAVFVVALLSAIGLAIAVPGTVWVVAAIGGAYALAVLGASLQMAVRERRPALAPVLPPVFAALHLPYALGSLWGLVRIGGLAAARAMARVFRRHPRSPGAR